MARTFAQVQVSIWDQADFVGLTGSAQRLYFALMTRVETSMCGCIEWHSGRLAQLSIDGTPELIEEAATELENARFIVIDRTTDECLLRTMVRHDKTLQRGPKVAAGVVAAWRSVYSKMLRSIVAEEVSKEQMTSNVRQVVEPLIEWHIEQPTEYAKGMPTDKPTDTVSAAVSRQPTTNNHQPSTSRVTSRFDEFWKAYPKRVAKKAAERAWLKAVAAADPTIIIAAAQRYADQTKDSDPRFTKHPATWLNGGCWEDEAPAARGRHDVVTPSGALSEEDEWDV